MNTVHLSTVQGFPNMSTQDIIDYCLDRDADCLLDDFGYGIEYSLSDLTHVWENIRDTRTFQLNNLIQ